MIKIGQSSTVILLGCLLMTSSAWLSANDLIPKVVLDTGAPALKLPSALAELIRAKFPDLKVPTQEDMTGEWAKIGDGTRVPYVCWGDFNGDGLTDVALILLGKGYWRILSFHQMKDGSYVPLRLEHFPGDEEYTRYHPAQEFELTTLKAGEALKINRHSVEETISQHDTITLSMIRNPDNALHYEWTEASDSKNEKHRQYGFYMAMGFGKLTD